MRFLGLVALIGLFLSILDASTASADQCPARDSPIATDRPDVTNSSLVVPQGSFQSENGINFSQRSGNHEFDGTESRLRWGMTPPIISEIKATGPLPIFRPRSSRRAVRDRLANRGIDSILAVIADVHRFGTFRGLTTHFGR